MKTSEILNGAREVMMEKGHAKGRYVDGNGRVCLHGALMAASLALTNQTSAGVAKEYLRRAIGEPSMQWNDRDETTEAMALGALHEASLLAKEAGD